MGAEEERDVPTDAGRRERLRRVALIAGLTVLLAPALLHVVFQLAAERPSDFPAQDSAALHIGSVGTALLRILPIAALLLALLLRPERYRVVFWLAPLWFGAETVRKVITWSSSIWAITQSPVDLLFLALNAAVAVVLLVARPTAARRPQPEPPH